MGFNEWEQGTITLPADQFDVVNQAIAGVDGLAKKRAYDLAHKFWDTLTPEQRADRSTYLAARIERFFSPQSRFGDDESADVVEAAFELTEPAAAPARVGELPPDNVGGHRFASGDVTVTFTPANGTVTWQVQRNNKAVYHARRSMLGVAFFRLLQQVRWAPGTGGLIVGNDEINEDERIDNDGGDYVAVAFGYIGAAHAPDKTVPFINHRGQRIQAEVPAAGRDIFGRPKAVARFTDPRLTAPGYAAR